ncbi:hypothetical protein MKK63_29415 [Methylobacterium sp. J-088]|uniref:hypothetical protein n=1 Tax=unclassified Methylobacterium TaxID=2615210 RepID=UPI001FB97EB7|nr:MULTISPECIES: hypothetical protein [unclassified Methylobacterium]MCJ2066782.1 hypothetical protein [Methylobacterium sp. J-088]
MTADARILVGDALPPLRIEEIANGRTRKGHPMPRLGRIVCALAALALPAFGIAVADTVHRIGDTKASQAAAPVNPSDGAAAPRRAVTPARAYKTARAAMRTTERREVGT